VVSLRNDGRLLAGMTAKASLTWTSAPGIVVPLSAVTDPHDGSASVFTVADGRAHRRDVTLGPRNDAEVQVLSGLAAGEVVATSGVSSLLDGMEVAQ